MVKTSIWLHFPPAKQWPVTISNYTILFLVCERGIPLHTKSQQHCRAAVQQDILICGLYVLISDVGWRGLFWFPQKWWGPHSELALESANTNHSICTVRMCACACVRPHLGVYVLRCPPLNLEGGVAHMHAHTHTLALCSPWVVCAANVYDLHEANPTGLFQWIENDLQDAARGPKKEQAIRGNLRAPFQVMSFCD